MSRRRSACPALLALIFAALIGGEAAAAAPAGGGADPRAPERVVAELASARAPAIELRSTGTVAVPGGGAIHRFEQRVGGVAVAGGEAVIADPASGPPALVADHTRAAVSASDAAPIEREAAIGRAVELTAVERLRARPAAHLRLGRSGRLVWEVLLPSATPLADLAVTLDAATGTPVGTRDLLRRATGSALLYVPNPVVTQGGYDGLSDRRDEPSTQLANLRVAVELPRLVDGRGCLRGQYADVRLGRRARSVCRPSLDWTNVQRSDDVFEALMAYYHVDRTRAYIDSLGLSEGLRPKPQRVRVNAITADNSYFSPLTRGIILGTGGVDDGEDGDVIVHEYGHSVQDQQTRFFGRRYEGASMGEGFGDYLAAAVSSQVTGGDPRFDPCMFEWDATSYTNNRCLRRTDRPLTARAARRRCGGDPHCAGIAWSSALWELRGALGADPAGLPVADRVLLESHFMLTTRANFRDGARALLAADDLLYAGAHRPQIAAEMVERGFCPAAGC